MINIALFVFVVGAVTVAIGVDLAALVAWAKGRWR
jgi:hypothetical protein